jgi:hypothetical protein
MEKNEFFSLIYKKKFKKYLVVIKKPFIFAKEFKNKRNEKH